MRANFLNMFDYIKNQSGAALSMQPRLNIPVRKSY